MSSEDADTDEETDSNPNPVISLSEKRNEASGGRGNRCYRREIIFGRNGAYVGVP